MAGWNLWKPKGEACSGFSAGVIVQSLVEELQSLNLTSTDTTELTHYRKDEPETRDHHVPVGPVLNSPITVTVKEQLAWFPERSVAK